MTTTSANEADVEQVGDLLHAKEEAVWADSGYRGGRCCITLPEWPPIVVRLG